MGRAHLCEKQEFMESLEDKIKTLIEQALKQQDSAKKTESRHLDGHLSDSRMQMPDSNKNAGESETRNGSKQRGTTTTKAKTNVQSSENVPNVASAKYGSHQEAREAQMRNRRDSNKSPANDNDADSPQQSAKLTIQERKQLIDRMRQENQIKFASFRSLHSQEGWNRGDAADSQFLNT